MINKKDIDCIIKTIEQYTAMWDIPIFDSEAEEFARVIEKELLRLKSNEIILAKGKVQNFNGEYWIGDNSEYSFMVKVKDLKGKNISIYIVEE